MKKIDVLDNTIRVLTQDDANALAFREKLSIKQWIGLVAGFASIMCLGF